MSFKSESGFTRVAVIVFLLAIIALAIWYERSNSGDRQYSAPQTQEESTDVNSIEVDSGAEAGLDDIDKDINSL